MPRFDRQNFVATGREAARLMDISDSLSSEKNRRTYSRENARETGASGMFVAESRS
jgi:hypothetical protein